jgi:site-specific DNA-methyltransferase (adenine-specific)
MITPSRWLTKQGQGVSEDWADSMIHSNHIVSLYDFVKETDCFPNVEIKGGVSYFLYRPTYLGVCKYVLHRGGEKYTKIDFLDSLDSGVVIRDPQAISIINAVSNVEGEYYKSRNFSGLVSPLHFYDKDGQLSSNWKGYSKVQTNIHTIKYYLNRQLESCGYAWIKISDIPKNQDTINVHKIFISAAYNGGDNFPHQIIGKPFYGEPGSVCSQTYNCIGYKEGFSKDECSCVISYIRSKFFRYMVSVKKKTQGVISSAFQFVPLQNFTAQSDIDWSKSIPEIDQQLYKKYNLSEDEINFIEKMIKPME